ncbi:DNA-binding transcriptional MerR regulator [Paenibacillus turicensis]|uniref:DNA-binding transcriptional MerR regulator n=1 Tax=Paenibacillus turicensis TaxID=160487 RepID=A0ABS4FMG6_9BACL|nr:MerR family transcriptional regulator [Paenibacillus turicensis]MBP1903776.1 DNA-binding transcriptional MerR regulator [Paenibacillus turicensis]
MFQIGQFSKLTQVTIRMLRYYDEMGLLKPATINQQSGYRLYAAAQIPTLNKIVYLRDCGFNVSEIATALSLNNITKDESLDQSLEQPVDQSLIEHLERKRLEVEQIIEVEQEKLRKIEMAKKEIFNSNGNMHYQVSMKSIPSYSVLSLRKTMPDYYAEGQMWEELSSFAAKENLQFSQNTATFSIYHDLEYKEQNVDIELCVPVKNFGLHKDKGDFTYRTTEPIPNMASTMVYGDFSNVAGAYISFAQWLEQNSQYLMLGPTRQIVHYGPWNESNPENYVTEIQIPLLTLT